MLKAIFLTGVIAISVAGGFYLGMKTEQGVKEVNAADQLIIEPYHGVGSGVLKHGTVLELAPGEQYSNPSQIVGNLNDPAKYPGTWVIRKAE